MPCGADLAQYDHVCGRFVLKEKEETILAFCDEDQEYASLMTEYMERQKNMPWTLHSYTDVGRLMEQEKGVDILVVAESIYCDELKELQPKRLIVLNESGMIRNRNLRYVDKYQQADQVVRELLAIYLEVATQVLPRLRVDGSMIFLGFFSPVHRSLQTSYALTMAHILAKEHKTLYLNFEYLAGRQELLADMQTRDLADLLYFMNAEKDKFSLRMQSIVRRVGKLDYVPPMKYGQNLLSITAKEWLQFFKKLQECAEYDFVVMDLSECLQGLFDILRICQKIYTCVSEDRGGIDKLMQYEKVLEMYSYEDILEKTIRCQLPRFRHLPSDFSYYTRGELTEYVEEQVREFMKGGTWEGG